MCGTVAVMPRPYADPVEIITAPIPAQSPFIPADAKIVVGAIGPAVIGPKRRRDTSCQADERGLSSPFQRSTPKSLERWNAVQGIARNSSSRLAAVPRKSLPRRKFFLRGRQGAGIRHRLPRKISLALVTKIFYI